ncbi:unnamed protein product [Prorocentrum cordatum]|uniref:RNA-editing substrate-binding complex 6 protein domain-containing protein n=1 Tax=Prorocentrum cordatum TaxID=2364126 RepID=A0ABN9U0B4_9DINO|nr:unnamed protein product [Polarella glacialis]
MAPTGPRNAAAGGDEGWGGGGAMCRARAPHGGAAGGRAPEGSRGDRWATSKLRRNKWINRQVTANSGSMEGLLQTIHYHITEMNAINLVTALHRVTKLAVSGQGGYSPEMLLENPNFKQLFSTIKQQIEGSARLLLESRQTQVPFEVQCMSMVCWSCATLRLPEEQLLSLISGIAAPRLSQLKPFELSNMVWAYAKLHMEVPQLFVHVAKRMIERAPGEFSLQCLSIIAWSFATAKQKHGAMFGNLAVEIFSKAAEAKPQEIANTLWAYAKNRSMEVPLFTELGNMAICDELLWAFKPQELSNTAWAFATVGLPHEPLFRAMVPVAIEKRREMSPQNTANILWAYSKLRACRQSGLVPALLGASLGKLSEHKPQEISAIVWAASHEAGAACRGFFEAAAQICVHRLHDFPPHALAYMVEAFASVDQGTSDFSVAMVRESLRRLHHFESSALAHLLPGVALLAQDGNAEHPSALGPVCARIAGHLADLPDADVSLVSASLERLPASVAEGEPLADELRQAAAAEEQRRERARSGSAGRPRAARRAQGEAPQGGGRPAGEARRQAPSRRPPDSAQQPWAAQEPDAGTPTSSQGRGAGHEAAPHEAGASPAGGGAAAAWPPAEVASSLAGPGWTSTSQPLGAAGGFFCAEAFPAVTTTSWASVPEPPGPHQPEACACIPRLAAPHLGPDRKPSF